MALYLIRHTTPEVESGVCYGSTDLALAATFPEEFLRIQEQLPDKKMKVYASPLKRCLTLAKQISSEVSIDHRLVEYDFGDWEMKSWDAIHQSGAQAWFDDYVNVPAPNGDSLTSLSQRVVAFYQECKQEDAILVTHAGPIRCLLAHIHNTPLKDIFSDYKIDYGQVVYLSDSEIR